MKSRGMRGRFSPLKDIAGPFTPYLYIGPALIFVTVFLIYPLVAVAFFSLLDWSGIGKQSFTGFMNYAKLFVDPNFWSALTTNLIYLVFFSLVPTILGLIIAAVAGRTRLPGERYFRAVLLTPQVIASVAMGVVFGWIFAPGFGVVNGVLKLVGLERWEQPWLGSTTLAPISVGLVGTWMWIGFAVIVFVSGIQKIDESIFDAARIDGASEVRQFFSIILPELRAELVVVIVVTLIRAFGSNVFGIVAAITNGGYRTTPLSLLAYKLAFVQSRMGYGAAVIVLLMVLIVSLSAITFRVGEGRRQSI